MTTNRTKAAIGPPGTGLPPPRTRAGWMDVARGAAVALVVFYHSATFAHYSGASAPELAWQVDGVFAPVRMPVLVFLSGLLLAAGLRKGTRLFLQGKARHVLWPYLVWVGVYAVISYPVYSLPVFFLGGTTLWYLLFLGVYYLVALVLRGVPTGAVVVLALIGAVLAPDGSKNGERLLFLFAFFMAGHWCATHPGPWRWVLDRRAAVAAASSLLVIALVLDRLGVVPRSETGYGPATLAVSAAGIVLMVRVARLVGEARWSAPLRFTGRHSIIYYTTHFPTIYIGAHLMGRWGGLGGAAVFTLLVALAFAVATALALSVDRHPGWRVQWLFAFPSRRPAVTASAPAPA